MNPSPLPVFNLGRDIFAQELLDFDERTGDVVLACVWTGVLWISFFAEDLVFGVRTLFGDAFQEGHGELSEFDAAFGVHDAGFQVFLVCMEERGLNLTKGELKDGGLNTLFTHLTIPVSQDSNHGVKVSDLVSR